MSESSWMKSSSMVLTAMYLPSRRVGGRAALTAARTRGDGTIGAIPFTKAEPVPAAWFDAPRCRGGTERVGRPGVDRTSSRERTGAGFRTRCDGARACSGIAAPLPPPAMPACYLYILPLLNEDVAKVGISVDPLARVRAFATRYYECFDLERSGLVGFDSVAEARRRETALHRQLRPWNAARPLTVPLRAGGHTEWYRGAAALLREEAEADRGRGLVVHQPAGDWWRERLLQERPLLFEWAEQYLLELSAEALAQ